MSIDQPAATLWFHPHDYPLTAGQVIRGVAGLMIIEDEESARLPLPTRWGVDDIPLIIQDRRFTPNGEFFERMNYIAVVNGYVGDVALVNGARYPEARTARGWIRLANSQWLERPQLQTGGVGRPLALRHRIGRRAAREPGRAQRAADPRR